MKGKVKFFNVMKGFGFIAGDDGKEYFVHKTGLKSGVTIGENDEVSFDVEQGDRGPKAVNVSGGGKGASKKESQEESEGDNYEESTDDEESTDE